MSIDKWIHKDPETAEEEKLRNKIYKNLSKEEKKGLKRQKIRDIIPKDEKGEKLPAFLEDILEFTNWLNNRTYLKGDIEKIEIWIENLYRKLKGTNNNNTTEERKLLNERYKEIPPNFIEEKMRIAINKKLRGTQRTSSDTYYLRKMKSLVKEKLKEAEYYEILRQILES
jgi:hypothetical protein